MKYYSHYTCRYIDIACWLQKSPFCMHTFFKVDFQLFSIDIISQILERIKYYSNISWSQIYKRRSRDMETEIEEEMFLQFPVTSLGSLDASSGSLSSVSLSDKSMSTDNVEEYFGDVPFAGKQQQHQQHQHHHHEQQQKTLGCTAWCFSSALRLLQSHLKK